MDDRQAISSLIPKIVPSDLEGRDAVTEMKDTGGQWKQMEWAGFWFEHRFLATAPAEIGGGEGPRFDRVAFDYERDSVWDLKVHSSSNRQGRPQPWTILNDREAIEACIAQRGGVGFVVVSGLPEYDETGDFKTWHDLLKGAPSDYVRRRRSEGAPSRVRKAAFRFDYADLVFFDGSHWLERGTEEGWLTGFQTGMRNSNDTPRRSKVQVDLTSLPDEVVLERIPLRESPRR